MSETIPDDEPVTDEDRRRIREGERWLTERGGKGVPMEEVLAEYGLTPEDFPLGSPAAEALRTAPLDDEEETMDEAEAVDDARRWLDENGGKGIPHAEAMRRLNLK